MEKLPHRLQDTSGKVIACNERRLKEDDTKPLILCSRDIEAMYLNITNELGLASCSELLEKRELQEPSTDCVMETIQITVEESIARFNHLAVKQCDGTTMGPYRACSYAVITADLTIDQKVLDPKVNTY